MKLAALAIASLLLPAAGLGADASRCQLGKDLYNRRQALGKQEPAGAPSDLRAIDQEYAAFLEELSSAAARKDLAALQACCDEASRDRAGGLFCRLTAYLAAGRVDSRPFLKGFPGNRAEAALLWDLDAIAGSAGERLFPPKGASQKMIDELFLLVLDQRDMAISRYFNLAANASAAAVPYMDKQIRILLEESPAVVVNQWLELRRYRPKLKAAVQEIRNSTPAAEMQKVTRAVRALCTPDNPDCAEILALYEGR